MSDPVVLLSTGDVVGPAGGVTDNSMVLFNGTSGKLIKGNNAVVTSAGLALLDDVDAAAQRTTLQLKTGATTDKTVSPNDHTIGRLLKVGDAGILSMQDMRSGGYVTGQPQDLYGLGFSVGFADGGTGGLGIPGLAIYTYGILEINSHGTGAAGAGIQRRFTDGTTGAVYTQSMATATTWGAWIKNGASAAWRLSINSVVDLNNITEGGWFQGLLGPTNANLPAPATYFYLQVMNFAGSPGNCTQVAYEYTGGNTPRKFTRGNYSGTWTAWSEDWTTANLVKTVSATDGTIGRMLKVGDFGVGSDGGLPVLQDELSRNGLYIMGGGVPGVITNYSPYLHMSGGLDTYAQLVSSRLTEDWFVRSYFDGGWKPFRLLHHTGNILQTTGTSTNFPMSQKAVTDQLATRANTSTQVIAGTGLTGGGTLADNCTLSINPSYTPIGVGQSYQDVTASRTTGTIYTNTTGRAIEVCLSASSGSAPNLYIDGFVNEVQVKRSQTDNNVITSRTVSLSMIVPPGATYRFNAMYQVGFSIFKWVELR